MIGRDVGSKVEDYKPPVIDAVQAYDGENL